MVYEILKTNQLFITIMYHEYTWNIFSRHSALYLIKLLKKHARIIKMDRKQLKIALSVLDAVRNRFSETN